MDRKSTCSEFWEFLKIFVRDLYAKQKIVDFGTFQAFSVSVTYVFSVQIAGSTPAASTNTATRVDRATEDEAAQRFAPSTDTIRTHYGHIMDTKTYHSIPLDTTSAI
jgi:hypothetical protein